MPSGLGAWMALALLFALLAGVAAWLQFGLLARLPDASAADSVDRSQPDYYIENLISTGADRHGTQYQLIAARLTHYPGQDRAELLRPHLIQYRPPAAPRHIHADAGWLYDERAEVLFSGNVRVVEGDNAPSTAGERMLVRLKARGD